LYDWPKRNKKEGDKGKESNRVFGGSFGQKIRRTAIGCDKKRGVNTEDVRKEKGKGRGGFPFTLYYQYLSRFNIEGVKTEKERGGAAGPMNQFITGKQINGSGPKKITDCVRQRRRKREPRERRLFERVLQGGRWGSKTHHQRGRGVEPIMNWIQFLR